MCDAARRVGAGGRGSGASRGVRGVGRCTHLQLHVPAVAGVRPRRVDDLGLELAGADGGALEAVERLDRGRRVAQLERLEHQLVDLVAGERRFLQRRAEHVAVVHRRRARRAAADVEHERGAAPRREGGEHGVLREEEGGDAKLLEGELRRLLARRRRVERRLGHQQRVVGRVGAEAALVRVLHQRLRRVPVGDDPVGHRRLDAHAVAAHRHRVAPDEVLLLRLVGRRRLAAHHADRRRQHKLRAVLARVPAFRRRRADLHHDGGDLIAAVHRELRGRARADSDEEEGLSRRHA